MDEGIVNVKIIAIGKGQYSTYNSDWTDDNTIPVVTDPSPNDIWTNWGASQRDLFFLILMEIMWRISTLLLGIMIKFTIPS